MLCYLVADQLSCQDLLGKLDKIQKASEIEDRIVVTSGESSNGRGHERAFRDIGHFLFLNLGAGLVYTLCENLNQTLNDFVLFYVNVIF